MNKILGLFLAVSLVSACTSNVTSTDRFMISINSANAQATNKQIQKSEIYVKEGEVYRKADEIKIWFESESIMWQNLEKWSKGEQPLTGTK